MWRQKPGLEDSSTAPVSPQLISSRDARKSASYMFCTLTTASDPSVSHESEDDTFGPNDTPPKKNLSGGPNT